MRDNYSPFGNGESWGFAPGTPATQVAALRQLRDCLCAIAANSGTSIGQAVAPTFDPPAADYDEPQSVTLSSTTPNATFFYTLDGSTPDEGSTPYTGAIQITENLTLKAITVAAGYTNSAVSSGDYDVEPQVVATPTFSPPAGTYESTQAVTISTTTLLAQIYYTIDGSAPTISSTLYVGPITVASDTVINAVAVRSGYEDSQIASASYTIDSAAVAAPTISFSPSGTQEFIFSDEPGAPATYTWSMSTATPGADIYYVSGVDTDHQPTDADTLYTTPGADLVSRQFRAIAKLGDVYSAVTSAFHLVEVPVFYGWAGTDDLDSAGIRALDTRTVRYIHDQIYPTFEYRAPTGNYVFSPGGAGTDYYYIAIPESYPMPYSIKLGAFDMPMAADAEGYTEDDGSSPIKFQRVEIDTGIFYRVMRTLNQVGGAETTLVLANS